MYSIKSDGKGSGRIRFDYGLHCALAAFVLGSGAVQGGVQCPEDQKLAAADTVVADSFGASVSVSGDVAVVGAFGVECVQGPGSCGAAYVYRYNGTSWAEGQKLTASDGVHFDFFGASVALSGDMAVVGAEGNDCAAGENCGAAYVFRYNGTSWAQEQKLTASDAMLDDAFGGSVSMSGNVVAVAAVGNDCLAGYNCGSVYVFRYNGTSWVEEQKLTAFDAGPLDSLGRSVSVSGDMVVVGAHGNNCAAGEDCGAAYVFRYNGTSWILEQKLTASDAMVDDLFGWSVSASGDTIVVGALGDDCPAGLICGAAHVFRFDGSSWFEAQRLTANERGAVDQFGSSVSVSGQTVVVGAVAAGCGSGRCGAAYVFRFDGTAWVEERVLSASDAAPNVRFGDAVSESNDTVFVGAKGQACASGINCGSAYVFRASHVFPPTADPSGVERSRYVSFVPNQAGEPAAFQVTVVSPPGYPQWDGTKLWVGLPVLYSEDDLADPSRTFTAAGLQCEPVFFDWSSIDLLHVFGAEIMPNTEYEIRAISVGSGPVSDPASYSCPFTVTTGKWGDAVEPFYGPLAALQPDFKDMDAIVAKFLGAAGAPIKASAQLRPNVIFPDRPVNFSDIAAAVGAFLGLAYVDDAATIGPCTCPSAVTCGATACAVNIACGDGFCVDGFCTDACGRCSP